VAKTRCCTRFSAQVSYYSALIQKNPAWAYVGVYADEAVTGTKDSRAEFNRMMGDCRAGGIDVIVTKSISRFARNTVTLLSSVRELKALGIDVAFEQEKIRSLSADGELMLTILASYAQEESRSASENVKWRIRNGYKEGRPSNHITVFGYDYAGGNLTVIPEEAEVVRMIFADYLSGMGLYAIAKKLTQSGIPTKKGGRWSYPVISDILRNEKYAGVLLLQKGFITDHLTKRHKRNEGELPQYYIKDHHEPIIDRETFEVVQAEMARRSVKTGERRGPVNSEFSGLIRCKRCGVAFCRKVSAAGTKYAKPVWACRTYTHFGKDFCPARRIPEDILKEKCAEALGLTGYDPAALKEKVKGITVPDDGILVFTFSDGTDRKVAWQHRSRSESWTDGMRDAARAKARGGAADA
jgi:DNA invertase Pin-like site-specific DNA recombinase